MTDRSRGYDELADDFARIRDRRIGAAEVRAWASSLHAGAAVLDVACGTGEPITHALVDAGCRVWAIDASPRMVALCAARFPGMPIRCDAVEASDYFERTFDGIVAWGVMFLIPGPTQLEVIDRLARALVPGGRLLFTAPPMELQWNDAMTGLPSLSLGRDRYRQALADAGLTLTAEFEDAGGNHYYDAVRRAARRST